MSIHTLSDLAVQDISDESAAVHSGGVDFTWFANFDGTGRSRTVSWSDNRPVGHRVVYDRLPFLNNDIEAFQIDDAQPGRTYQVEFFDGNDGETNRIGVLTLDRSDNGQLKPLAPIVRNRTSSLVITRIPG